MPKAPNIEQKDKKEEEEAIPPYSPTGEEKKVWDEYKRRKNEMINARRNVQNINLDDKMRTWDKLYFNREARNIPASELDEDSRPIAINNAYGKIQAALSILIGQNPDLVLDPAKKKYVANQELIRSLAKESWRNTNSLWQLRLSVFNSAKRGWFAGRTMHRQLLHEAKFPIGMNDNKIEYDEKLIRKVDDVWYKNLDNHNVWIDEEAVPYDPYSARDAMHREVWHIDKIRQMFPESEYPNMKFVKAGGNTQKQIGGDQESSESSIDSAKAVKEGMTEVFFYEHQFKDWYIIEVNGVMVVWEPLPQNHKRLSYVWGHWNLRSAETIYGIGVVELMERDDQYIDRILNMSLRQLLLSINPPGFYSGTEDFENENIKLKAGVYRRTLNPDDITHVEIPPMKGEAFDVIDRIEQKEEQRTGITKSLEGEAAETDSNTAFELGVNREAALKRLQLPLRSLQIALDWEFANRVGLIKQIYSEADVQHLTDENKILDYMEEVNADPDFYYIENEGIPGEEEFFALKYREIPLNVEQDEQGNFRESEQKAFFNIKPEYLHWNGDIRVDIHSILTQSKEMTKAETLRFTNLLVPMFELPPEIGLKPAKQLILAFDKQPEKWLPDEWLQMLEQQGTTRQRRSPAQRQPSGQNRQLNADTVVPEQELEGQPGLGQRLGAAFRGFKRGQ